MSSLLKNHTAQGEAAFGSYLSATSLTTIPTSAFPPAQATFRHLGTKGYWTVTLKRTSGPTSTDYSYKLGPNEAPTEIDPPIGNIYALADANVDGNLSWYVGWRQ